MKKRELSQDVQKDDKKDSTTRCCCSSILDKAPAAGVVDPLSGNPSEIKEAVRGAYGSMAKAGVSPFFFSCGTSSGGGCCNGAKPEEYATKLGYTTEDVQLKAADGANLGLGCGKPTAIASLRPGVFCPNALFVRKLPYNPRPT